MAFGYSRDDIGTFLPIIWMSVLPVDPFASLDTTGVGQLVETACVKGRAARVSQVGDLRRTDDAIDLLLPCRGLGLRVLLSLPCPRGSAGGRAGGDCRKVALIQQGSLTQGKSGLFEAAFLLSLAGLFLPD